MSNDASGHWTDKYRDTFAQFVAEAREHREKTGLTTVLFPIDEGHAEASSLSWVENGKAVNVTLGPSVSHLMLHLDVNTSQFLGDQLVKIKAQSKEEYDELCMALAWRPSRLCPICDKKS